ncbi:hypothetical protein [Thalassotalea castellviae]|uniref:Uncharacterized protein n=1 Tax=Thalassotalea castellviae TaxID=3075612 RepID=A0ABU2ZZY3_9GAMM|nr:hypothetical protein [Thalassotalea sp. W431]MDT0603490.1 hypothetical protein [Thalassotalea sp. W431]
MLAGLTSLTNGGGMSASSSATATNGDFGSDSSYNVGNMTFGAKSGDNNQMIMIAGFAVVALLLWKK